jgi:hypothetical protein
MPSPWDVLRQTFHLTLTDEDLWDSIQDADRQALLQNMLVAHVGRRVSDDSIRTLTLPAAYDKNPYFKQASTRKVAVLASGAQGVVVSVSVHNPDRTARSAELLDARAKFPFSDSQDNLIESVNHAFLLGAEVCVQQVYDTERSRKHRTPMFQYELPFPQLYGVFRDDSFTSYPGAVNTIPQLVIPIMEPLDCTLFDYLQEPMRTRVEIYDVFAQVFYHLHYLQQSIHFVHGDCHLRNIMLKRRPTGGRTTTYEVNQHTLTIESTHRVYFIDFGETCSTVCGQKPATIVQGSTTDPTQILARCTNSSFDLCLILGCVASANFACMQAVAGDLLNLAKALAPRVDWDWHKLYAAQYYTMTHITPARYFQLLCSSY